MTTRIITLCAAFTCALLLAACGDSGGGTDSESDPSGASSDPESGQNGDDFFFCTGFDRDCGGATVCVLHVACDGVATSAECEAPTGCDMGDQECWSALYCDDGFELVESDVNAGLTVSCQPLMCEGGTDSGGMDSGGTDASP